MSKELIYHYTSQENFLKIIKSKKLFLTDVSTMNDTMDCIWYQKYLIAVLDDFSQRYNNKELANKIYVTITKNIPEKFVCCFSENCDLLSQWRAYADNGRGIAIGFNKKFCENKLPFTSTVAEHSIGLYKVNYNQDEQQKIIYHILHEVFSNGYDATFEQLCTISRYSTIFKNPAFREEQEWRVIYTPIICPNNGSDSEIIGGIREYDFRDTSYGISPFFKWSFTDFMQNPIKEIILGPQNNTTLKNVKLFLYKNKFNIEDVNVYKSNASYRT